MVDSTCSRNACAAGVGRSPARQTSDTGNACRGLSGRIARRSPCDAATVRGMSVTPSPRAVSSRIEQSQVTLTSEGERRLEAATPAVRGLEDAIEEGLAPDQIAAVKAWLVASVQRLEEITTRRGA